MPEQIAGLKRQIATSEATIANINQAVEAGDIAKGSVMNVVNHHETLIVDCQAMIERMGVSA